MNTFQLVGEIPGRGSMDLLASPALAEAQAILQNDPGGSQSYSLGGALLFPYPNRIRGRWVPRSNEIEVPIGERSFFLPANHRGKATAAEPHALHGLILDSCFKTTLLSEKTGAKGIGVLEFQSPHWPSQARIETIAELKEDGFYLRVQAQNTGSERMPVAIGWHPYFRISHSRRAQAVLRIPARRRLAVDHYDNVFPTGEILETQGTPYDFSGKGRALGDLYLDDCLIDVERNTRGEACAELIDPAAGYGIRILSSSPSVRAFQVYAPLGKDEDFIAIEPQFNWPDPLSPIWEGRDTGMVWLQPGESVDYSVAVQIFEPTFRMHAKGIAYDL